MLEIACFDITSAETALRSVANRIEFCSEIQQGGLTPNIEEFRYLKNTYKMPIYVMIRPKGGSFLYTDDEFKTMEQEILAFKNAGADGFVFGILTSGSQIDIEKNRALIHLAENIPCTFHRAFDKTSDLDKSINILIDLGFKTVLTSGGKTSAMEGKEALKHLVKHYSDKINILIGGGVRSTNIAELKSFTGGQFFHSSAIPPYEIFANDDEIKELKKWI